MSLTVFVAVIGAALLHAAWNAVVKGGEDKRLGIGSVVMGHVPIALICVPFVPLPSAESLPYLFAGMVIHFAYQVTLVQSYRVGDLTQVYPIARGSAPLIVAVVSVAFLGVVLSSLEILGVVIIGAGPGGLAASLTTAHRGLTTLVVEAKDKPGGQPQFIYVSLA